MNTLLRPLAFSLVAATVWSGCGEEEAPPPAPTDVEAAAAAAAARVAAEAAAKKAAKAKEDPAPPFTYSPIGKRDPFRSYLADLQQERSGEQRKLSATEQFALDQYRLTGLVTGTSQPKAMVEDPQGVGHTLRVGSRIGKNGGRVTRISAQGVIIVEEFVNPVGKRVRVPITLKLPEDPESITLENQ